MPKLEKYELVAVFVGLDLMSECQIERDIFRREVGKVYAMLDRGVNLDDEISMLSIESKLDSKILPDKKSKLQEGRGIVSDAR
jgi:hypothetical protein